MVAERSRLEGFGSALANKPLGSIRLHSTSLRYESILVEMHNSTFVDFMAEIGARHDANSEKCFVNCEAASKLAAQNIRTGTMQFIFQFHDYFGMISKYDHLCPLNNNDHMHMIRDL